MAIARITLTGDTATITLPQALLEQLGIVKDNKIQVEEIQVDVVEQTLVARTIYEAERSEKVKRATDHVFEKYEEVFTALAEGTA